jgi:hypothetical protein
MRGQCIYLYVGVTGNATLVIGKRSNDDHGNRMLSCHRSLRLLRLLRPDDPESSVWGLHNPPLTHVGLCHKNQIPRMPDLVKDSVRVR